MKKATPFVHLEQTASEERRTMSNKKMDELMARIDPVERLEAKKAGRVVEYERQKALQRLEPEDPHLVEVRRHRRLYEWNTIYKPAIKPALLIIFGLWFWFKMRAS